MLEIRSFVNLADKKEFIKSIDSKNSCLVVNDLRTKFEFQAILLQQLGAIEEDSILRANEVWQRFLLYLNPEMKLVSKELIQSFLAKYINQSDEKWLKKPGTVLKAYQYMVQLIPLISHPNSKEVIKEWFLQNTESFERWGKWYLLCHELWSYCLQEKLIHSTWASGVLFNEPDLESLWQRDLYIDLGVDLQMVEAELLLKLSENLNIYVLLPEPIWAHEFSLNYQAYIRLNGGAQKANSFLQSLTKEENAKPKEKVQAQCPNIKVKRMATMLSEVKDVCYEVRRLAEKGVKLHKIAIVSSDIGSYWPVLSTYLKEEGIDFNRAINGNLQSFPDIGEWLAQLRIATQQWTTGDIEQDLYSNEEDSLLNVEQFRKIYAKVYGHSDLARSKEVAQRYSLQIDETAMASRDEFVNKILTFWKTYHDTERLEVVLSTIIQEAPKSLNLSFGQWLQYLYQLVARLEVSLEEATDKGVLCVDLSSIENLGAEYYLCLGLSEESLRQFNPSGILLSDRMSIAAMTGFYINSNESSSCEFYLRWVLDSVDKKFILYFSESDFSGSAQGPSLLWLKEANGRLNHIEELSVPQSNRWDKLQQSRLEDLAAIRNWSQSFYTDFKRQLQEDLGELEPICIEDVVIKKISATKIEDYASCPFVFMAKSLFGLTDLPSLDMDIDRMSRGMLTHAIFAKLLNHDNWQSLSNTDMESLIEECKKEEKLQLGEERRWPSLLAKYMELTKRFIAFEKEYFTKFPKVKNIANEYKVIAKIDSNTARFTKDGDIDFIGFIDRMDQDAAGNYIVIDYKSTKNDKIVHFTHWLEKDLFQLALYTMALESGFGPSEAADVAAANFYIVKDFQRDIGFIVPEQAEEFYKINPRKKNLLTLENKIAFFNAIQEKLLFYINEMRRGKFYAQPKDVKNCSHCEWRKMCRAPHLS